MPLRIGPLRDHFVITFQPDLISVALQDVPSSTRTAKPEVEVDLDTRRIVRIGDHHLSTGGTRRGSCTALDPDAGNIIDNDCAEMILRHLVQQVLESSSAPRRRLFRLKPLGHSLCPALSSTRQSAPPSSRSGTPWGR
jgi:hypothetical protein